MKKKTKNLTKKIKKKIFDKKKFDEKIFFTLNVFNTAIKKNKKKTFVINKRWIQKEEKIKDAK